MGLVLFDTFAVSWSDEGVGHPGSAACRAQTGEHPYYLNSDKAGLIAALQSGEIDVAFVRGRVQSQAWPGGVADRVDHPFGGGGVRLPISQPIKADTRIALP